MRKRKVQALKTMGEPESEESILELLRELKDHRVDRTKAYSLEEVLFLVLAAVVSGVNHLTRIEEFGKYKLEWFRSILPYESGIPSHDTIGRILGQLDPDALEGIFLRWMASVSTNVKGVVAVDGKTLRGALRRGEKQPFVHMVSAFGAANGLVYGTVKTDEKSNEITAIPRLLDLLHLNGAIVTIDAIGCQQSIADKIITRGADFMLAVKRNQPTLGKDLSTAFHDVDIGGAQAFQSIHETEALSHGRGEWRRCEVLDAAGLVSDIEKWPNIKTLVRVTSERRMKGKVSEESRYFACSIENLDAEEALAITRSHWSIENRLHWMLDVAFREDECHVWAGNAAENLVVVRHIALNLLRSVEGVRGGIATRRSAAGWSDEVRLKVLAAHPD